MPQSRWFDEFHQHPFQARWTEVKNLLNAIEVDDQTVLTSVFELARLKRVVAYLDGILDNIDAELTPRSVWTSYLQQVEAMLGQLGSYVSNRNIGHVANANENADNLLSYVRPFMALPTEVIESLEVSARAYSATLGQHVTAFQEATASNVDQILQHRIASESNLLGVEANKEKIASYAQKLFEGTGESPSIQDEIEKLLVVAGTNTQQITDLHSQLIVGTPKVQSIQAQVRAAEVEVLATRDKTAQILDGTQGEVRHLTAFHEKIFGKLDVTNGKLTGGLEAELDTRTGVLRQLETDQNVKHAAMFARIESLLPGATSAGLATAYNKLKESFTKPIELYTILFYGSLGSLVLAALVMAIQRISIYPELSIDFVSIPEWDAIFKALIFKAPFIAPVVWLALFSSTRRSQYERLQQEYAHKEALASSYESYKLQLKELKESSEDLQRELIAKAIDCIAYNASSTLDGKHEDKTPSHQLLEKLSPDEFKKLLEFAKTMKNPGN